MARTTIAKTTRLGPYPSLQPAADALDIAFAAATGSSGSSGNQIAFGSSQRLTVLFWNTHATTAYTVTISSVADGFNRTGDIAAYSLAAGDIGVFVIDRPGWAQTDAYLYLEATNAAVKFAAWEG